MLKLGEKIISDIYLGDKKIAKVFLGDKLVYQANKPIFLDYVEFDGNSWIDIDYIPSSNTRVVGKFSFTQFKGSGANYVFGVFGGGANFGLNVGMNRGILNVPWGSSSGVQMNNSTVLGQVYSFDISKNGAYIDGVLKLTASQLSATFTATKSFFVGWANGTATEKLIGNIYPMQMYEDEVLVKDLRPCIDPNGVVCMYDMITKKYHYNIGTGTLTAGNVIRFVDYIYFDNSSTSQYNEVSACYINTGIQNQDGIWAEVTWRTTGVGRWLFGMGYNSQVDNFMYGHFRTEGTAYIGCGNASNSIRNPNNINGADGEKHTAIIKYDKYIFDGFEKELTGNDNTYEYFYDIYLGTTNYLKNADGRGFIGEIYNFKLYNNMNELILDLRPCVVNGVAGFYDMVTGKVFTNAGTGTLKASGRFVESIVFDGASWIDTGIVPVFGDKLEIYGQRKHVNGNVALFSAGTGSFQLIFLSVSAEQVYYKYFETGNARRFLSPLDEKLSFYEYFADGSINKDGTQVLAPNEALTTQTVNTNLFIGGRANKTSYWIGKIGNAKLIASNGVVVLDLRPYVDENGTACFKDIVTGKLFYNQGTGKLEYTE